MKESGQPASLYVHIPFCHRKCAYCDFNSYAGLDALLAPYVDALDREMARIASRWPRAALRTVYIGGGTPTVLPPEHLALLLGAIRDRFDLRPGAEVTIEANPGTLDVAKLEALLHGGVTRLSLGVQSLDDAILNAMGRIHTAQEARRTVASARAAGLSNVSLDLMYGWPGQSMAVWQDTLAGTLALAPNHLSLYALGVETETPLGISIGRGATPEPDDDQAAEMYLWAMDALKDAGYRHYEISNWAGQRVADDGGVADGRGAAGSSGAAVCRHNMTYWLDEPYWGVGAGAHSYVRRRRSWNVRHPGEYIGHLRRDELPVEGWEAIDRATEISEFMILGLRLMEGVSDARFAERFGCSLRDIFGRTIDQQIDLGLLEADERGIRLSRRGYLLGNQVFAEFLLTGRE